MKQYPYIQPTDSGPWSVASFLVSVALCGAALGLYAVAATLDDKADAQLEALARAERARLAMPPSVEAAYEAGIAEATLACDAGGVRP